jgi:REP element-mobilizing transposase RayT
MDKFNNKYRIPSARLQSLDYGSNGAYFITICTKHRQHLFGEIYNNEMQLNDSGQLAEKYWLEIPTHFPFIELGNFVVMPNHTHGILIIDKPDGGIVETPNLGDGKMGANVETPKLGEGKIDANVETPKLGASTAINNIGGKNEKWKPNTIGSIINQYKRIVTINARLIHADFAWQSRFHDHIIRNAKSFEIIQHYIANNPLNWEKDKFF